MNEKKKIEVVSANYLVSTRSSGNIVHRNEFPTRWHSKMRSTFTVPSLAVLMFVTAAFADPAKPAVPPDQVSVFKVPLVCPAAPNIGCGSRAKPILLELEKQDAIAGAWLNREGTLLAIVWKQGANRKTRRAALTVGLKDQGMDIRELGSKDRERALAEFPSSKEWLQGSDVDRLSEEEAGIVAAKLVRKIKTIIPLDDGKALLIERQSAEVLKRCLTGKLPEGSSPREEVLKVLREHLDGKDVAVLQEQLRDYRPGKDQP
jgi:hypothetical protein